MGFRGMARDRLDLARTCSVEIDRVAACWRCSLPSWSGDVVTDTVNLVEVLDSLYQLSIGTHRHCYCHSNSFNSILSIGDPWTSKLFIESMNFSCRQVSPGQCTGGGKRSTHHGGLCFTIHLCCLEQASGQIFFCCIFQLSMWCAQTEKGMP